jgi:hypothetical protein
VTILSAIVSIFEFRVRSRASHCRIWDAGISPKLSSGNQIIGYAPHEGAND